MALRGEVMTELMSVSEVARVLGVSKDTVKRWARRGLLPQPLRVGTRGDHVFDRAAIEEAARRRALPGGEAAGPAEHQSQSGGETDAPTTQ
jgi:excisionase family DNA binding protein